MLSRKNQFWLDEFIKKHGRRPRILHIGNIANNAYNNAKILLEAGLENYVICYDYYHIMGCPEWEDADLQEFRGDQFRPKWYKQDLAGFKRPEWFIQGSLNKCSKYLIANLQKEKEKKEEYWEACLKESFCFRECTFSKIKRYIKQKTSNLYMAILQSSDNQKNLPNKIEGFFVYLKIRSLLYIFKNILPIKWRRELRKQDKKMQKKIIALEKYLKNKSKIFLLRITKIKNKKTDSLQKIPSGYLSKTVIQNISYVCKKTKIKNINLFLPYLILFNRLLKMFDFTIAYSTDPIYPLLACHPFFAFEHGTLREIPFQKTCVGRLTALAYKKARHVFVTNFDCRENAGKLAPGRFTMINHPFDEDHGKKVNGWRELRHALESELASDILLFHPTRHDWVEGTGYADKSNDVFLKAFCELRNRGMKIGLVCCEWGSNVSASKRLVANAKLSKHVKWVQPLPVLAFERTCLACDLVVDQFKLGSFGGVLFKAMAVGRPILTFLDKKEILRQYQDCPPVINCRTQEEIVSALLRVFGKRTELKRLGKQSRDWIKQHHNKATTVNSQVDQFRMWEQSKTKQRKHLSTFLG